jgi:alanine racemase
MSHCWTELDTAALQDNLSLIRRRLGASRLILVVKSNAYGHGMLSVAKLAWDAGVRDFAVTHVSEGIQLRRLLPDSFILLLGVTPAEQFSEVAEYNLTPVVVSVDHARQMSMAALQAGKTLAVHLKIDTGMSRLGMDWRHAITDIQAISDFPGLTISALCSHLACADDKDLSFTREQADRFKRIVQGVRDSVDSTIEAHLANSDGVNLHDDFHWDAARCGILAYGYSQGGLNVRPCLSWKTSVLQIKDIGPGDVVGYGSTYTAKSPCRIAVCDCGYADGYFRAGNQSGRVLINGRSCSLAGRVSMNYITVLVPDDVEVHPGDEVVLLGSSEDESIDAFELAERAGTIPYEVLTSIRCSPR